MIQGGRVGLHFILNFFLLLLAQHVDLEHLLKQYSVLVLDLTHPLYFKLLSGTYEAPKVLFLDSALNAGVLQER